MSPRQPVPSKPAPRKPARRAQDTEPRPQPDPNPIPTRDALVFGGLLLGQVSGILVAGAVLGFAADALLSSEPLGLAIGVLAGGALATFRTLTKVRAKLTEWD